MIKFICRFCKIEFEFEHSTQCAGHSSHCSFNENKYKRHKQGGISLSKFYKKKRDILIKKYNKDPKLCLNCNLAIKYEKRKTNKFCSHACSDTYNNLKRDKGQKRTGQSLTNIKNANKKIHQNRTPEQRKLIEEKIRLTKIKNGTTSSIKKYKDRFCSICNKKIGQLNKYEYCQSHYLLSDEYQISMINRRLNHQTGFVFNEYQNKNVYLMSSIEFKYVEYLKRNNTIWIKPEPLKYFLDDRQHLYFPDFYLPTTNEYIEIKGYMWPKDKLKMKNVLINNPLINLKIIMGNDVKQLINSRVA